MFLFFFSFENIYFSYRNSVNISFVFLMAHLIKIDVYIEISDLKVKECFISLVRFTVIMGRKFRDPSWCLLKIEGPLDTGKLSARASFRTVILHAY